VRNVYLRAWAFAVLLAIVPASARAADTEAPAIAALLSIGIANAPAHFSAIRGDLIRSTEFGTSYKATKWPDETHFTRCVTSFYKIDPTDVENWSYQCNSTPRTDAPDVLFKTIESAVRANLPAGYASPGVQQTVARPSVGSLPYETWKRSGSPDVVLQLQMNKDGTDYYVLSIH
jgi:hypothetical protein